MHAVQNVEPTRRAQGRQASPPLEMDTINSEGSKMSLSSAQTRLNVSLDKIKSTTFY